MILEGLPGTISLISVTTGISFVIGNILGAFQAWPRAPRWIIMLMPPLLSLSATPFSTGADPRLCRRIPFAVGTAIRRLHPAMELPICRRRGLACRFAGDRNHPGFTWRVGARHARDDGGTTQGQDYVTFAEAKGLADRTLFVDYGIRNAMFPQVTALALSLGQLVFRGRSRGDKSSVSTASAPCFFRGLRGSDLFLVQGIVFIVIVAIGLGDV